MRDWEGGGKEGGRGKCCRYALHTKSAFLAFGGEVFTSIQSGLAHFSSVGEREATKIETDGCAER